MLLQLKQTILSVCNKLHTSQNTTNLLAKTAQENDAKAFKCEIENFDVTINAFNHKRIVR